ncbi:uncharacterized protein LOC119127541 [Syngnathus acus]|uniref:uncharacterized protein LOC119127541 n=1 Tax=Syngnathus acus TaxID=161584 RepID=UPI001885CBA2|nr:uncharacterized protein LOC119127541 [Syngnathus acus]
MGYRVRQGPTIRLSLLEEFWRSSAASWEARPASRSGSTLSPTHKRKGWKGGLSPFNCVFGYQPLLFGEERLLPRQLPPAFSSVTGPGPEPAPVSSERLSYWVGQQVWLSTRDMPLKVESLKLAPKFIRPFPVVKVISPSIVRLRLLSSMKVHPTFHVLRVKPVHKCMLFHAPTPAPPRIIDGGPVYTVPHLPSVPSAGQGPPVLCRLGAT